jgi:hypothetical protein
MKAVAVIRRKLTDKEGNITEVVVWRVPADTSGAARVQYRLAFIPAGRGRACVIFDNHHPKGHHKHVDGVESSYSFTDVEGLVADFEREIERWKETNP